MLTSDQAMKESVAVWHADLALRFDVVDQKTILRKQHRGPLVVQRPFYPEHKNVCHVYLIHPPGGVVGGDVLNLSSESASHSHALITTPAAGKFYRSEKRAVQNFNFCLRPQSRLEWFPQENIFFDASRAQLITCFDLEDQAKLIAWDITVLGRPAAREGFIYGSLQQSLEIRKCGRPLYLDRAQWHGDQDYMMSKLGLQQHSCVASMVVTLEDPALSDLIRRTIQTEANELFSVTQLKDLMVCRFLGEEAERAKRLFIDVWALVRPKMFDIPACRPRIWAS